MDHYLPGSEVTSIQIIPHYSLTCPDQPLFKTLRKAELPETDGQKHNGQGFVLEPFFFNVLLAPPLPN